MSEAFNTFLLVFAAICPHFILSLGIQILWSGGSELLKSVLHAGS
jgi:hypothetical protein